MERGVTSQILRNTESPYDGAAVNSHRCIASRSVQLQVVVAGVFTVYGVL